MIINTRDFGEIDIQEDEIITFQDGIPGFEELTKYIVIENPEEEVPFHYLQSVENKDLSFVIINPFLFKKDYDFQIPQGIVDKMEIKSPEDILIYSIVVIPDDISKMTANLLAPIVVNFNNNQGKQIVLDGNKYHTKHLILEEMKHVG